MLSRQLLAQLRHLPLQRRKPACPLSVSSSGQAADHWHYLPHTSQNPFPIDVHCMNIGGDAYAIIEHCQHEYTDWVVSVKGQVFRDMSPGWNTVVKESAC
jgi:hypothetical protein